MVNIRKLNYFDKPKIKELSAFLKEEDENSFINIITNGLPGHLHYYLPLKYKVLNESYLLADNNRILGLITVGTFNGNPYKINISQLCFIENVYEVAQQLVEFIVAQYGAMGTHTFYVLISEKYNELSQMFINNCGFRQTSYEQIWQVPKTSFRKERNITYRRFKKSDVNEVADIYNESLFTHFKPTLLREPSEFCEPVFSGLKYKNEYRYVIEEPSTLRVISYFKISTADNENYTVDFNYSNGYDLDFDTILYFATREILKRTRKYNLFIKMKNYINTNKAQKEYFKERGFICVSTKNLLVKDFFKVAKEYSREEKFAVMGGLHNSPSF